MVNNAGIGTIGSVTKTSVDDEIAQVRVNVEAVIDLTTRAVQQMVPRGRGAILNVGSTAGFHPFPGQIGYGATKAFVKSYTEGLRGELAGTGVTVALLCPGPVRTEFLKSAGMDERTFAAAFPKFLWMAARDVARIGVDALDGDRGTVIPGLPSQLSTRLFQFMPRRLLMPLLNESASGPAQGPRQRTDAGHSPHPALHRQRESVAQRADRAVPADGREQFDPLLVAEIAA